MGWHVPWVLCAHSIGAGALRSINQSPTQRTKSSGVLGGNPSTSIPSPEFPRSRFLVDVPAKPAFATDLLPGSDLSERLQTVSHPFIDALRLLNRTETPSPMGFPWARSPMMSWGGSQTMQPPRAEGWMEPRALRAAGEAGTPRHPRVLRCLGSSCRSWAGSPSPVYFIASVPGESSPNATAGRMTRGRGRHHLPAAAKLTPPEKEGSVLSQRGACLAKKANGTWGV